MKTLNQHINRSALSALFIANCPSAEVARPETTGALRIAYGSNPMAMVISEIDS